MGKVNQKLEEDMMLYPESYSKDDSDYMTEAELEKQMEEVTVSSIDDEPLSTCCSASSWLETDICSECKEHADFETGEQDEDN